MVTVINQYHLERPSSKQKLSFFLWNIQLPRLICDEAAGHKESCSPQERNTAFRNAYQNNDKKSQTKNCYWDKTPLQVLIQHLNKYCPSNNSSHRPLKISKSEQIISYRTNTNHVLICSDYESEGSSRKKYIGIWFCEHCVWFIIWVFETTVGKLTRT